MPGPVNSFREASIPGTGSGRVLPAGKMPTQQMRAENFDQARQGKHLFALTCNERDP